VQAESEAWAAQARLYLDKEEDGRRALLKALGPRTKGALAVARAVTLLRKKARSELGNLLLATVTLAPEHSEWGVEGGRRVTVTGGQREMGARTQ
jgi:hypothetical protein